MVECCRLAVMLVLLIFLLSFAGYLAGAGDERFLRVRLLPAFGYSVVVCVSSIGVLLFRLWAMYTSR